MGLLLTLSVCAVTEVGALSKLLGQHCKASQGKFVLCPSYLFNIVKLYQPPNLLLLAVPLTYYIHWVTRSYPLSQYKRHIMHDIVQGHLQKGMICHSSRSYAL